MKVVLFAEACEPAMRPKTLQELLEVCGNYMEYRTLDEVHSCDLNAYDIVLLDGRAHGNAAQDRLFEAAQNLRHKAPRVPIVMLSMFDPAVSRNAARHGCGVAAGGDGNWHMHCRLKELAWNENQALLHDALEREPLEPTTFEYRG
jgi:DNA-binding transcriptional LysR family regulator